MTLEKKRVFLLSDFAAHNQTTAGQAGAIKPVVVAVSLHMANAEVCESGCGALWNMAVDGMKRRGAALINFDRTIFNE